LREKRYNRVYSGLRCTGFSQEFQDGENVVFYDGTGRSLLPGRAGIFQA
jgi:hypothetical protein